MAVTQHEIQSPEDIELQNVQKEADAIIVAFNNSEVDYLTHTYEVESGLPPRVLNNIDARLNPYGKTKEYRVTLERNYIRIAKIRNLQ